MSSNRPHHLLEQVPLTVSPFVSLPSATTLSYNYKSMPSNIPQSGLGIQNATEGQVAKERFVVSSSGHAAHPEDIIASCRALQAHVAKMQDDADRELKQFEERIRERELAEKRRVAPGWLDSESRLLEPERKEALNVMDKQDEETQDKGKGINGPLTTDEGAQLDRAFGTMALR